MDEGGLPFFITLASMYKKILAFIGMFLSIVFLFSVTMIVHQSHALGIWEKLAADSVALAMTSFIVITLINIIRGESEG